MHSTSFLFLCVVIACTISWAIGHAGGYNMAKSEIVELIP